MVLSALEARDEKKGISSLVGKGILPLALIGAGRDWQQKDNIGLAMDGAVAIGPLAFASLATNRTGARILSGYIRHGTEIGSTEVTATLARLVRLHGSIRESEKSQYLPNASNKEGFSYSNADLNQIEPFTGP